MNLLMIWCPFWHCSRGLLSVQDSRSSLKNSIWVLAFGTQASHILNSKNIAIQKAACHSLTPQTLQSIQNLEVFSTPSSNFSFAGGIPLVTVSSSGCTLSSHRGSKAFTHQSGLIWWCRSLQEDRVNKLWKWRHKCHSNCQLSHFDFLRSIWQQSAWMTNLPCFPDDNCNPP